MSKTSVNGSELSWIAHIPIAFSGVNITLVSKDFIFFLIVYFFYISFCQIILLYKLVIIIVIITIISIVIIIIIYLCIYLKSELQFLMLIKV